MAKTPLRHFTHPDYGLVVCDSINTVRVLLHYINESGKTVKVNPTWVYHSDAGLATAISEARKERDRLLSLPEYQAYLATIYADPTGEKKTRVRPRSNPAKPKGVITQLTGLFMKVDTKPLKSGDGESYYLNVMAHIPNPESKAKAKRKLRGWSVNKHGLAGALRQAAEWRYESVGDAPPTEQELAFAEAEVRRGYKDFIGNT